VRLRRLPLFPLPLVLFPRAPLPLHIFEPRYRRLLADCLGGNRTFGIVLRADELAERDIPEGTVGCEARIESAQHLPDGRSNVLVVGTDRFTLVRFVVDAAPYHVAEVAAFVDKPEPASSLESLARRVRGAFERVGKAARAIADDATPLPDLPDDPAEIAFAVAQYVDLELSAKQRLLSSPSASERLRQLDELLSPAVESVEVRATTHARARTNGHGPQPTED